jgi:hypothetical protein
MKIYRYVPDTVGFRTFLPGLGQRWWPDGITLPEPAPYLFPPEAPWQFAGNRFPGYPGFWPISDFPAYHLSLPAWSPRAAAALRGMTGVAEVAAVHFDGEPNVVARPGFLPEAIDVSRSHTVLLPGGEIVALQQRWFREDAIVHDVFWGGPFLPYPDVYLTERFVRTARDAGLTGTARFELVGRWAPVRPPVPSG